MGRKCVGAFAPLLMLFGVWSYLELLCSSRFTGDIHVFITGLSSKHHGPFMWVRSLPVYVTFTWPHNVNSLNSWWKYGNTTVGGALSQKISFYLIFSVSYSLPHLLRLSYSVLHFLLLSPLFAKKQKTTCATSLHFCQVQSHFTTFSFKDDESVLAFVVYAESTSDLANITHRL